MSERGQRENNDIHFRIARKDLDAFANCPGQTDSFTGQFEVDLLSRGKLGTGQALPDNSLDGFIVE